MKNSEVKLTIKTDLYFTADFLRELSDLIEEGFITEFESEHGSAKIEWPEEYLADCDCE